MRIVSFFDDKIENCAFCQHFIDYCFREEDRSKGLWRYDENRSALCTGKKGIVSSCSTCEQFMLNTSVQSKIEKIS